MHSPMKWLSEEGQNPSHAMNLAFLSATKTYVSRPALPTSVILNRCIFIEASLLQSLHSLFSIFSHLTKSLLQQEA